MIARLTPHPGSTPSFPETVSVDVESDGMKLWLRFLSEEDADAIVWPAHAVPGRADELWQHTCFEVFVETLDGYREFNLSPSGQWASYAFDGYRSGMRLAEEDAEVIGFKAGANWALTAWIDLPPGARRLGLSAVIEDQDGGKTYWALAHPSDKPDFHHPDSFTLVLPATDASKERQP